MSHSIIEEKESRVLKAYAVTPLSIREYFLGKGFFAVGLSFALSFLSAFILLGNQATYGPLFWIVLMAIPVGLLAGFIIGTYADSQLGAVALLKGLFFFLMAVPLGSFFVDKEWQVLFYPFFNYWVVKALLAVFLKEGDVYFFYGVVTLLTTIPLLFFVLRQMRRRLSL
ncbi:MAG: ABC transporter permease [Bacillota bacterium]